MIRRPAIAALALMSLTAQAEEAALSGAEISALLPAVTVVGTTWRQTFSDAGGTTYTDRGRPSQGRWWVEEDRYCSSWPPSDAVACYGVRRDGAALIWIDSSGARTESRIEPR